MQDSTHIEVSWKTHAIGAIWIAVAAALTIGSCAAASNAAMSLGELAVPALISLVVAAFVPSTQHYLPWGRWWKRWRERAVQRGIEELEREVDDEASQVRIEGAPYRGAIVHATKPRKRRSDRRFIVALVVGSILTILFTLGVVGFLNRHDLAKTMAASGILATMVLAFASSRDQGRLEAKERLRIEAGCVKWKRSTCASPRRRQRWTTRSRNSSGTNHGSDRVAQLHAVPASFEYRDRIFITRSRCALQRRAHRSNVAELAIRHRDVPFGKALASSRCAPVERERLLAIPSHAHSVAVAIPELEERQRVSFTHCQPKEHDTETPPAKLPAQKCSIDPDVGGQLSMHGTVEDVGRS